MFRTINLCLLLTVFAGLSALNAQATLKYGHMNLGNLLESLPETKSANLSLKAFADKLSVQDDSLQKSFQAEVKAYKEAADSQTLAPIALQQKEAELQKQQQFIQQFEQDAQKQVTDKREELLKPILAKIEAAVKDVATENGYLMVFDTSTGVALYANTADDVTALVKKKLGIQ